MSKEQNKDKQKYTDDRNAYQKYLKHAVTSSCLNNVQLACLVGTVDRFLVENSKL